MYQHHCTAALTSCGDTKYSIRCVSSYCLSVRYVHICLPICRVLYHILWSFTHTSPTKLTYDDNVVRVLELYADVRVGDGVAVECVLRRAAVADPGCGRVGPLVRVQAV